MPNKKALWLLRGGTLACVLILTLSLTVFREVGHHAFCVGLALGLLVGITLTTFQVRRIDLSDETRPSDVQAYSIR